MTDHKDIDAADFELRRQLRELAVEREPSHDLWPGIAQRLDQVAPARSLRRTRRRSRWTGWTALAASVLGVAIVTGFWPGMVDSPSPQPSSEGMVHVPVMSRSLRIQEQAMTAEYQAALSEVGSSDLPLPLQAAAAELDRSAIQIREAIERDPQSSFLLTRLRDVYSQRLRLSQRGMLT
ncbi:MAG: hypothetical protein KDI78_15545 [Xanthomonadales bacterium]|nr:hypothetical protein [Xanthomonadales bacterium]